MLHQLQRLQAQNVRDAKEFNALTDSLANLLLLRSAVASAGLVAPSGAGGESCMVTLEVPAACCAPLCACVLMMYTLVLQEDSSRGAAQRVRATHTAPLDI